MPASGDGMLIRHEDTGALTGMAKSVIGSVASALVLAVIYGAFAVWSDVQTLKEQQAFYHGTTWPPRYQEAGGKRAFPDMKEVTTNAAMDAAGGQEP